jgi:alpha/beta superfamily hydrolase
MPLTQQSDDLVVEAIRFRCGPWQLAGELAYAGDAASCAAAVIAGPHPLLGGTMTNNVVRALGDGLARQGIVTLRFDYRGVGASEGPAADVAGQLAEFWRTSRVNEEAGFAEDLATAVAFLRSVAGASVPLAMVGYSFGCSLLASVDAPAATPLALVAPTVGTHAYESFAAATGAKLVIAPDGDFAADGPKLSEWFERLRAPRVLLRPKRDGHFFRGHEGWLVDTVGRFIRDHTEGMP